jgi:Putative MetA-pathway of phenol degradation
MAKIIALLFFLVRVFPAHTQIEKIDTDRPDETESAAIVPKNYFQAEVGFNRENGDSDRYVLVHPTALLKYGFGRIELRLEVVCHSDYARLVSESKRITGVDPIEIGFKALILEETKLIPKTSVIVHLGFPMVSSKVFRTDHVAPSFRLVTQKAFTNHFGIGTNLGMSWDGYSSKPTWLYTFSPGFNIGQKWYAYVEAFGFIQKNELPQHSVDGGIAYYLNDDMKLDVSGGFGLSEAAPKNYFALGFSFRINTGKTE